MSAAPTKWGNQFTGPRHVAVANYRKWMNEPQWQQLREAAKRELRGKGPRVLVSAGSAMPRVY